MTRDEVLDVLDTTVSLKRRKLDRTDVPVMFMGKRIAVMLPSDRFSPQERVRMEGTFQVLMTKRGEHAFIDWATHWQGIDTPIRQGFT